MGEVEASGDLEPGDEGDMAEQQAEDVVDLEFESGQMCIYQICIISIYLLLLSSLCLLSNIPIVCNYAF